MPMNFVAELKRRNVIRMAGLYLVGAWLVVQVAGTILPMFGAPEWITRSVVIVLAIGFVPALVIAWVFELTPQGLKRDADVSPQESIAPQTARRMDRMLLVVFVLAIGYFAFDKFVLAPRREAALVAQTTEHVTAETSAKKSRVNPRSIAVLPFVNMTTDAENEFFSDGLSEEILNSLARIDGMQVVGRTSSFQFKGKNEDLRIIGEKLGVGTVLEGSVRREGERARITAQLIRASDGIHLWSETYDRTVNDTLAVQLDIAEKVADVLDVVLDDRQRARMRRDGVKDVDAFIAYQKGLKLYNEAHARPGIDFFATMRQANAQFATATVLDPEFSLAYFAAADLYEHQLLSDVTTPAERIEARRLALEMLDHAAATGSDPQRRLLTVAERQMLSEDWRGLPARIEEAFAAPGCSASNWLPVFAGAFGYGDAIEDFGARASACDPLNFINFNTRAWVARTAGNAQLTLAIRTALEKVRGSPSRTSPDVVRALIMLGRFDEARNVLDSFAPEAREESYYMTRAVFGRAVGEDPKAVHAQLQSVDRGHARYQQWQIADAVEAALSGDRTEANRRAAILDARPAGGLLLALVAVECQCGAPFDLDATPNFKARLAESGLRWPPPQTIKYPPRAQDPGP